MAKGNIAKDYAIKKIAEAFGSDFVGVFDKKVYINCPENGEMVQVALAMTCPKTPVGNIGSPTKDGGIDFEALSVMGKQTEFTPAEITQDELKNISDLLTSLGLN